MDVDEVVIYHKLYDNPGMAHVTSDGKKIYFILVTQLARITAPEGTSYSELSDEEINRVIQQHLTTAR